MMSANAFGRIPGGHNSRAVKGFELQAPRHISKMVLPIVKIDPPDQT